VTIPDDIRQQHAEQLYRFIVDYFTIHKRQPTLQMCIDATRLNVSAARRALFRLRHQKRISQTSLRLTRRQELL
jgi:hypothetical protein